MLNNAGTLAEQYSFAKGCQCDSITIAGTNESVAVTSEWVALNVTDPSLTHGLSGTPTWEALDVSTMVPFTGLSGGTDPVEWNAAAQKVRGYSMTVNNAVDEVQFIGDANLSYAAPTTHRGTISLDIVYKDTAMMSDVRTLTKRAANIKLGPSVWIKLTGVVLEAYDKTLSASSTEAMTISYSGKFLKGEIVTTDPTP